MKNDTLTVKLVQAPTCDWCGYVHDPTALCTKRPRWSRRGFIALVSSGLAGAAIGPSVAFGQPEHLDMNEIFRMIYARMLKRIERRRIAAKDKVSYIDTESENPMGFTVVMPYGGEAGRFSF